MLDELNLFRKAALVAQDPVGLERIQELGAVDRGILRNEALHKWRQPKQLYYTVIFYSIGAAIHGWDLGALNAATLTWPDALGLATTGPRADLNAWIVGIVNSAPYVSAAAM
jgi:hypothetical protein